MKTEIKTRMGISKAPAIDADVDNYYVQVVSRETSDIEDEIGPVLCVRKAEVVVRGVNVNH